MGTLRFLLAVLVVIAHLSGGFGEWAGPVAVFSFYVISGYLITTITRTTYSNGVQGLIAFAANRFLRLYPAYWFIAGSSFLVIGISHGLAGHLNSALSMPASRIDAVAQVTILGLHKIFYLNPTRFVPTAWSLNIELVYYAAIALVLGRNRWTALAWWIASAALALHYIGANDTHDAYFTIWGPTICFATGSVLSHVQRHVPVVTNDWFKVGTIAAIVTLAFAHDMAPTIPTLALIYTAIPLAALAILAARSKWTCSSAVQSVDTWFADLSYPIFLSHWPIAVVIAMLGLAPPDLSVALMLVSLPAVIAFSALVNRVVEEPIRTVRSAVRKRARARAAPPVMPETMPSLVPPAPLPATDS